MNAKTELRNFYDRYGQRETLEAIADLLETMAIHKTDEGDSEGREPFDAAADAVWNLL